MFCDCCCGDLGVLWAWGIYLSFNFWVGWADDCLDYAFISLGLLWFWYFGFWWVVVCWCFAFGF